MNATKVINRIRAIRPQPTLPPLWREAGAFREGMNVIRHSPRPPLRELTRPRGEVLLVPGFLAGDSSMRLLGRYLERAGYTTVPSGIARNVGCSEVTLARLEALLERHVRDVSRMTIVGHSRGGLLARALANRRPDLVSGVVMLGSPVRNQLAIHPVLWAHLFALGCAGSAGLADTLTFACSDGECCSRYRTDLEAPLPASVSLVSVYSRSDGLVDWRACRDRDGISIEVGATHIGMVASATSFRVVLDALDDFARTPPSLLPRLGEQLATLAHAA